MSEILINLLTFDFEWLRFFDRKREFQQENVQKSPHYAQSLQAEVEIFKSYGIDVKKDVEIYNAKTKNQDFIHTIRSGVDNKGEIFVCLHGYWSSNLAFVKLIKPLSKQNRVYSIDLPGQALSSRPEFEYKSADEIINFFTDSIEEWRKSQNIEKFNLVGHSFGGYLAANYAMQYPQNIKNLILLSPAGVKHEKDLTKVHEGIVFFVCQKNTLIKDFFYKAFDRLWQQNYTVSGMYQKPLFPGKWLLNNYLESHLQDKVNPQLFQKWYQYYDGIMRLPVASEKAMTGVLNFPSFSAKLPLEFMLQSQSFQKHNIPTHFYFGDDDWMESETAQRLIRDKLVKGSFKQIPKSGHKVAYDNPQILINDLLTI